MKNYLDEIYTISEFKRDNPTLAEQAERALQYLKGYCQNSDDVTYVIIEVEGYKCVAYLTDEFSTYLLAEMIAPGRPAFPKLSCRDLVTLLSPKSF